MNPIFSSSLFFLKSVTNISNIMMIIKIKSRIDKRERDTHTQTHTQRNLEGSR
jgi:hypothetical protein